MRSKAELGVGAEEFAEEELERAFQIGNADAFIHVEPFHLGELREVRRVDLVAAIRRARRDDADRRRSLLHRADLHRARMRPEEPAVGEVKGVLFVSCG
jgi:hypothetical protein